MNYALSMVRLLALHKLKVLLRVFMHYWNQCRKKLRWKLFIRLNHHTRILLRSDGSPRLKLKKKYRNNKIHTRCSNCEMAHNELMSLILIDVPDNKLFPPLAHPRHFNEPISLSNSIMPLVIVIFEANSLWVLLFVIDVEDYSNSIKLSTEIWTLESKFEIRIVFHEDERFFVECHFIPEKGRSVIICIVFWSLNWVVGDTTILYNIFLWLLFHHFKSLKTFLNWVLA